MKTLEDLRKLTPEEIQDAEALVQMIEAIKKGDESCRADVVEYLGFQQSSITGTLMNPDRSAKVLDVRLLFALSYRYPVIAEFCENDSEMNKTWKEYLYGKGYPDFEIASADGRKCASFFSRVKGSLLWTYFKNREGKYGLDAPTIDLLNGACEAGIFQALNRRLEINQEIINRDEYSEEIEENLEIIYGQMIGDAARISQLYWSPGHIIASFALTDIATSLRRNQGEKITLERIEMSKEVPTIEKYPRCRTLRVLHSAMESFSVAHQLEEHPSSQKLSEYYAGGKLSNMFKRYADGWENARKFVVEKMCEKFKISMAEIFLERIYNTAAEKTAKIMENASHYFDHVFEKDYKIESRPNRSAT